MATTTLSAVVGSDWTSLVDGGDFATCQLQVTGVSSLALAVATTEPAADDDGFVIVTASQPLVPFTLEATETIWGRAFNGSATVRIIQTEVTP